MMNWEMRNKRDTAKSVIDSLIASRSSDIERPASYRRQKIIGLFILLFHLELII